MGIVPKKQARFFNDDLRCFSHLQTSTFLLNVAAALTMGSLMSIVLHNGLEYDTSIRMLHSYKDMFYSAFFVPTTILS